MRWETIVDLFVGFVFVLIVALIVIENIRDRVVRRLSRSLKKDR